MSSIAAIIFSKDRALQLQGTLDSFRLQCKDAERIPIIILYRASNPEFDLAYRQLRREQAGRLKLHWLKEKRFKSDLLCGLDDLKEELRHLLFIVDDCLFVRPFELGSMAATLNEDRRALGFSLRLGRNTIFCYSENIAQTAPVFSEYSAGLRFCWRNQNGDFGYPLEVSSSLYRYADIMPILRILPFTGPNELEKNLAQLSRFWAWRKPWLWCAEHSLAFCAPVNLVQTRFNNRAGLIVHQSAEILNQLFIANKRIDVCQLDGHTPIACHEEVDLPLHERLPSQAGNASIAVLICILPNANPQWLERSIESTAQGLQDGDEIFLLVDGGTLVADQHDCLTKKAGTIKLTITNCLRHQGLAAGLNFLIDTVIKNERFGFIARMDADDVCVPGRFSLQRNYMLTHTDIDILGGWCQEIDEQGTPIQVKRMPLKHRGIVQCLPRRNTLNHPTVMIRREVFLSGLRYRTDVSKTEDYHLWITAVASGWRLENLPNILLDFRRDKDFFRRRSGFRQAAADMRVRLHAMHKLRQWSILNFSVMMAAGFLRVLPDALQRRIYLLRGAR